MLDWFRKPRTVPAAVVASHVESDRMREAKRKHEREERAAALAFARSMGKASVPMTPREQIAAEVAAMRARRKAQEARKARP